MPDFPSPLPGKKLGKQIKITIPPIPIEIQPIWDDLLGKYRSRVVVVSGGLEFTDIFWYLGHTRNNSRLLHAVSSHLYAEKGNYKFDDSYRLLKAVVLEGFFSLRESLAGLVNVIYDLEEDAGKRGSSNRILKEAKKLKLTVADYLSELIPNTSRLGRYLEKYRHPYVHREDLSGFSVQDITAMLVGEERPQITEFITESYETSRWMQEMESYIAKECATHLGLS